MKSSSSDLSCAEQQRVGCALGGIYTALSIDSILPVMHTGPGCIHAVSSVLSVANGGQNPIPYMESSVPCSNLTEAQVVFGASDSLRSTLEGALRYYKAKIFIIVSGCSAEIIGEDIEDIAAQYNTEERVVLAAPLPGFKGNNLYGHSKILSSIIDGYVCKYGYSGVCEKRVNIFGVVPHYDPMWAGTLEKLDNLLRMIGLEPNIIYAPGNGLEGLKKIPTAQFNLVIGPWVDLDIAKKLKRKFDTPYLHFPYMPIGPGAEEEFVEFLANNISLDINICKSIVKKRQDRYYYYFDRTLGWLFDMHNQRSLPREFFVNGSASAAASVSKYMTSDLGLCPRKIFITEDVPKKYRQIAAQSILDVSGGYIDEEDIIFTDDGGAFEQYLKGIDQSVKKSAVFGSIWDDITAKHANMPFVSVCAPYGDVVVGDKNYFGCDGAISLMADLYNDTEKKGLVSAVV